RSDRSGIRARTTTMGTAGFETSSLRQRRRTHCCGRLLGVGVAAPRSDSFDDRERRVGKADENELAPRVAIDRWCHGLAREQRRDRDARADLDNGLVRPREPLTIAVRQSQPTSLERTLGEPREIDVRVGRVDDDRHGILALEYEPL